MKTWLQSLAAAATGGAAATSTQVLTTGNTQPKAIGISAGVGALLATLMYLAKSPIPQVQPAPSTNPIESEKK